VYEGDKPEPDPVPEPVPEPVPVLELVPVLLPAAAFAAMPDAGAEKRLVRVGVGVPLDEVEDGALGPGLLFRVEPDPDPGRPRGMGGVTRVVSEVALLWTLVRSSARVASDEKLLVLLPVLLDLELELDGVDGEFGELFPLYPYTFPCSSADGAKGGIYVDVGRWRMERRREEGSWRPMGMPPVARESRPKSIEVMSGEDMSHSNAEFLEAVEGVREDEDAVD
jgi:hypothetical protein